MSRTPQLPPVARIERSEIRERPRSFTIHPGFHFVQPELRNSLRLASGKERKEAERRQTHCGHTDRRMTCTQAAHRARRGEGGLRRPSASGALACRRSTAALAAATERHRSAPVHALPGAGLRRNGCYPLPAAPVQRGILSPQTGRNAGRAFWPGAARERG